MESFAEYLKKIMAEKNLKASQVAIYSGLSEPEMHHILKRNRKPLPKTLNKLAKGLRIDVRELMVAAGYLEEEVVPTENAGIDADGLTEEEKKIIKDLIRTFREKK